MTMTMTMTPPQPRAPPPFIYGVILLLGAAMAPFLLSLDGTISVYARRSLSAGGLYALRDAARYSYLQAAGDVDASMEERARARAGEQGRDAADRCKRVLLYFPDAFAFHGHGSQLNTYLMAAEVATYLDRALVLVEPPLQGNKYAGGSQFGCPIDAFRETTVAGEARWQVAEDFPRGLSRLVQHPAWLSRGCPVPCADARGYHEWEKLAKARGREAEEMTCANSDGTESNVIAVAGGRARAIFRALEPRMASDRPSPEAVRWAANLGATPREAEVFSNVQDPKQSWEYVLGLMNRAGFLRLQPWIARDVALFLKSFDLPFDGGYDAIHVRRGDKLDEEARPQVLQYWRSRGHRDAENLPTDYVPFAHYLSQWDGPNKCPLNDKGEVQVMASNVYVATDDPVTVREEISALPDHVGEDTVLWNGCHRLTFFFNPTDASAFHLNGDGEDGFEEPHAAGEDSCFARYHRNVASVADMMILAKARTFIGEYNSNWGRLVRTLRVRLNAPAPPEVGDQADGGKNIAEGKMVRRAEGLTRTLDTRIAWGSQVARTPGY